MPIGVYPRTRKPFTELFWGHVQKTETCWLWTGGVNSDGYGAFRHRPSEHAPYRTQGAHCVSWIIHNGPIPEGQGVLHTCDVRNCVRPDHLFVGTQADNMRDCVAKGRLTRPKGEDVYCAKLTPDHVRLIRATNGEISDCAFGRDFGVSSVAVRMVRLGRTWQHVVD
jgi:hypothetical protein